MLHKEFWKQDWEVLIMQPFLFNIVEFVSPDVYCKNAYLVEFLLENYEKSKSNVGNQNRMVLCVKWKPLCLNSGLKLRHIQKYTHYPWIWENIGMNKNFSLEWLHYCHSKLVSHSLIAFIISQSVPMSDVLNYPEFQDMWDYSKLSTNPNLTIDVIIRYPSKEWNWKSISKHPGISMEDICNHPELPWDYYYLSSNPNLNITFILSVSTTMRELFNWNALSTNLSINAILNYPELPWDFSNISYNPNLTIDLIIQNPNKKWDWSAVSSNPGITMQDIMNHPEYPWNRYVNRNPNLNIEMVNYFPSIFPWQWYYITKSPYVTMQDIMNHPEYPWDWDNVSSNPNFNMEIIMKLPNVLWNKTIISNSPYISVFDIIKYPDFPWRWDVIMERSFEKEEELYLNNQLLRVLIMNILDTNMTLNDINIITDVEQISIVFNNEYLISLLLCYL